MVHSQCVQYHKLFKCVFIVEKRLWTLEYTFQTQLVGERSKYELRALCAVRVQHGKILDHRCPDGSVTDALASYFANVGRIVGFEFQFLQYVYVPFGQVIQTSSEVSQFDWETVALESAHHPKPFVAFKCFEVRNYFVYTDHFRATSQMSDSIH